jgi:NAD-dependent SIR2 family protein deacetylase
MPAVAVTMCQKCGESSRRVLADFQSSTTMPACDSCGGHRQVLRIFYDRRLRDEPVIDERRSP